MSQFQNYFLPKKRTSRAQKILFCEPACNAVRSTAGRFCASLELLLKLPQIIVFLSLLLIIGTFIPLSVVSAAESPVSLQGVKRVTTPPKIDGALDDPCWQACSAAAGMYRCGTNSSDNIPGSRPLIKLGYDQNALYLGCRFEGSDNREKNDDCEYTEDWLHVVFNPKNDPGAAGGSDYTFYSHGTGAGLFRIGEGNHRLSATNSVIRKNVSDKNGWSMEAAIPFDELGGKPEQGDIWSFTLARHQVLKNKKTGERYVIQTATSPGALETVIGRHGLIIFNEQPAEILEHVQELADKNYAGARWMITTPNGYLELQKDKDVYEQAKSELGSLWLKCSGLLAVAKNSILDQEFQRLRPKIKEAEGSKSLAKLVELKGQLEILFDNLAITFLNQQQ